MLKAHLEMIIRRRFFAYIAIASILIWALAIALYSSLLSSNGDNLKNSLPDLEPHDEVVNNFKNSVQDTEPRNVVVDRPIVDSNQIVYGRSKFQNPVKYPQLQTESQQRKEQEARDAALYSELNRRHRKTDFADQSMRKSNNNEGEYGEIMLETGKYLALQIKNLNFHFFLNF